MAQNGVCECPCPTSPTNTTSDNTTYPPSGITSCAMIAPQAQTLFSEMPSPIGWVAFAFLLLFALVTLGIYFEEIHFILKKHKGNYYRQSTTIWILAVFSVYSACNLLSACVPRAGTIIDLVNSVYFSSCLYNFSNLMVDYLGGRDTAKQTAGYENRTVRLNVLPCCCCVCLPSATLTRKGFDRVSLLVMQVTIVRPLTSFVNAVLWADASQAYVLVSSILSVVNMLSLVLAIYGLQLMQSAFYAELEQRYAITGKNICIQLAMFLSEIVFFITNILVVAGVITCNSLFPAKTRGDELARCIVVLIMLPLAIVGIVFFRRASDALTEKHHNQQQQQQLAADFPITSSYRDDGDVVMQQMSAADYEVLRQQLALRADEDGNDDEDDDDAGGGTYPNVKPQDSNANNNTLSTQTDV